MKEKNKLLSKFAHRVYAATGIFVFALVYLYQMTSLKNPQDKILVNPVIWLMIIMFPIILWIEWRQFREDFNQQEEGETLESETNATLTLRVLFFIVLTFIYLIAMEKLGFVVSTVLYIPLLMWVLGTVWRDSKLVFILLPILMTLGLYLLFETVLDIPLPEGLLEGFING